MEFYQQSKIKPNYIVYDDACHLAKYVLFSDLFIRESERAEMIFNRRIVCDRFHFLKHNDKRNSFCKENCDPDLYPELESVNTSVCEETNGWFGKYKHALKHMSFERYHFFLYNISDEYNKFKLVHSKYEQLKLKED
jgi:hypothetical protein